MCVPYGRVFRKGPTASVEQEAQMEPGGDSEVELNRKVCVVKGTIAWTCIEGYGMSLPTERAPSPNSLKLPAHTVGPPPAPRCEHRRSNTPENQSAHPLGNAHTGVLWWSDSSDSLCECRREGFFHVRWRNVRKLKTERHLRMVKKKHV